MKESRALAYACFAIVCVVWGTTYLGIAIALETIPPVILTGLRYTFAGLVILLIARLRGERIPRQRKTLANLAFIGFLMVGVGNLAVVVAEQWVSSGMAALLVATAPFWLALLEGMRSGGERLDTRGVIGMIAGFAGVALLVTPQGTGGRFDVMFVLGALIVQLGSIGWQWGTMRSKYTIRDVPILTSAGLQMLFGGLVTDVVAVAIGEMPKLHFTARSLGALAYLAIVGSVIAYTAYIYATAHLRTTRMSVYAYVNPVVAVVLGWLVLDEKVTPVSIVAMAVILGGVAVVQTSGMRRSRFFTRETPLDRQKHAA